MSAFRFYIQYPTNASEYSDFIEITEDVNESSVGNLNQKLDSNEYDIGTIKFNKISVKLRNETGKFSEANNPLSIFTFRRDKSILKIEWDMNSDPAYCGSAPCGYAFLSQPIEVYKGLLEDNSSKFDIKSQTITFNFLGTESIIGKTQVPFSALSVSDDMETTIYNILNQTSITNLLTVTVGNINVNYNFTPDSIADLEDKTCLEALNEILLLTSSVLYVRNDSIIVSDRGASASSVFTFYGASSDVGIESLHEISSYTLGLNRTFNFWKWKDTSVKQSFADSIDKFGLRNKELDSTLVTNSTKQTNILNALLTEFGFPKVELDIEVPMYPQIVEDIFLLDKINIDYPADYRGNEDDSLPARYGSARYGTSKYIQAVSSLIINVATDWKILNRSISIKNHKITFKIREV